MPAVPFGSDVPHVNATPTAEAARARLSAAGRQRGGREGRRHPAPGRAGEPEDRVEIAGEGRAPEAAPAPAGARQTAGEAPHIDIRV
jgi:hypothetical protein